MAKKGQVPQWATLLIGSKAGEDRGKWVSIRLASPVNLERELRSMPLAVTHRISLSKLLKKIKKGCLPLGLVYSVVGKTASEKHFCPGFEPCLPKNP